MPYDYLNDYIRTAIEKDVSLFEGISSVEKFSRIIRLLAGRVGNLLNASEVARDAGVSPVTAGAWIDGLARLGFVVKCEPYHSNLSKRLIKSPKIYFADVAVATRASGWSQIGPLMVSPQAGALFENVVHQELVRYRDNFLLDWRISFLRTREGEEVDFVVEDGGGRRVAIEVKLGGGDPLRAKLEGEVSKVLGTVPLLIVGLTTTSREWRGDVWTCAPFEIGETVARLLSSV
jgi:predicted AAA+ superfamily ATPase